MSQGMPTDWALFESRLAQILEALEEGQFLVLSPKQGCLFVQFAAQGSVGLRVEAISNHYLPESAQLGTSQVQSLAALGWRFPTGAPQESTPEKQPDGSPNFFRDYPRPVPIADVTRLAGRTLAEVHGIAHPGSLDYQAFDTAGRQILLPTLGLLRRPSVPSPVKAPAAPVDDLRKRLLQTIRRACRTTDLEYDSEGYLSLRFGGVVVIVQVMDDPALIRIASPVLGNVESTPALQVRLNEMNAALPYARLHVEDHIVYLTAEVPSVPFVPDHVQQVFNVVSKVADGIDEELQVQFGGRTAFGESRARSKLH